MKFTPVQWAWVVATIAYLLIAFLDIADVMAVPNSFFILVGLVLALISRAVGPSMADFKRLNRRG